MNTVAQILKSKGHQVWTISRDATVADAVKVLVDKQIGAVVIVEGGKPAGIFTERDFVNKLGVLGIDPTTVGIVEVMTNELFTVTPADSVNTCMALMTDNHIRHLPVLENGALVGILSIGDVVKDIIEEFQFMVSQFEKYIRGLR